MPTGQNTVAKIHTKTVSIIVPPSPVKASARSLLLVGFSSLLLFLFAIWQRPLARCLYTHIMNSFSPS